MKKIILLAAVAALFVGMLAVPASANKASDTGVTVNAQAKVGKVRGADCHDLSGGGIGLPGLHDGKKAYYGFRGTTTSVLNGAGTIDICGQIDPVAGVGAACGMSAGNNGAGIIQFASKTVTVSGVGWPASAGSLFVATGNASGGGKTGSLSAIVSAKGANCADKTTLGKTGTTTFLVDIVWEFLQNGPAVKYNK